MNNDLRKSVRLHIDGGGGFKLPLNSFILLVYLFSSEVNKGSHGVVTFELTVTGFS